VITIFRASYWTREQGWTSSWHETGDAAWRAINENDPHRQSRHPSVEPVNVIATRGGILRLLNQHATAGAIGMSDQIHPKTGK